MGHGRDLQARGKKEAGTGHLCTAGRVCSSAPPGPPYAAASPIRSSPWREGLGRLSAGHTGSCGVDGLGRVGPRLGQWLPRARGCSRVRKPKCWFSAGHIHSSFCSENCHRASVLRALVLLPRVPGCLTRKDKGCRLKTSLAFCSGPELWAYREEEAKQCSLLWGTEM